MTLNLEALKADAARAALGEVKSGMVLGLGTGSTMRHFVQALGEALASGALREICGVPTSTATEAQAQALGIPLVALETVASIDLAIDGADEVNSSLDLIKGLGGALVREKMVVQAARRFVVLADETKWVQQLGEKAPLPVEVIPFGWGAHVAAIRALGGDPILRKIKGGFSGEAGEAPYFTDNGNLILDVHFPDGIPDPIAVEGALRARAGVLDTGLFLGMAHRCYLADPGGVRILERPGRVLEESRT